MLSLQGALSSLHESPCPVLRIRARPDHQKHRFPGKLVSRIKTPGRRLHKKQRLKLEDRFTRKGSCLFPSCPEGDKPLGHVVSVSAGSLLLQTRWLKCGALPGLPTPTPPTAAQPSVRPQEKQGDPAPRHQGRGTAHSMGWLTSFGSHMHTWLSRGVLPPSHSVFRA